MQRWGFLGEPVPAAAWRWIATFLEAHGQGLQRLEDAREPIAELRAESCIVPALELERLRSRSALFFLDCVAQYVDHHDELRGLPLTHDVTEIGREFGIEPADAVTAVRMAVSGRKAGPPLELLFALLGHDRILMRLGAINSRLLHGRGLEPIPYGPDGQPFRPLAGAKPLDAGNGATED